MKTKNDDGKEKYGDAMKKQKNRMKKKKSIDSDLFRICRKYYFAYIFRFFVLFFFCPSKCIGQPNSVYII